MTLRNIFWPSYIYTRISLFHWFCLFLRKDVIFNRLDILASQLGQNLFNQKQPAWSVDTWSNTHNQVLYSRLICSTYPTPHSLLPELLLRDVLLVLILILAHKSQKVSKFPEDCSLLDLPGLIYYLFSNVIYSHKKPVIKLDWHNISRLKNAKHPGAIFSSASHKVHKLLLTLQLAAEIVLSTEIWSMGTAGPRIWASSLSQGGHRHTKEKEGNNLLHLPQPTGSC